jgi:UDP-N-acetylmuramate--alanine ligase
MDHVDYFHSMEQIRTSFAAFADKAGPRGYVVANADDTNVMEAVKAYEGKVITFGVNTKSADYAATNISARGGKPCFDIFRGGEFLCHIQLNVPGRHNIYNALAAAAVANICRMGTTRITSALDNFGGTKRRMEYKGTFCGADVYDDYAHHPTEIASTLDGVLRMGYDRVFCVFQPHTYSRLAELFDDFARSFMDADRIIVAEVYAAREENTTGVTSKMLAQTIGKQAEYIDTFEGIVSYLRQNTYEGDVIIVMGAGDTFRLFPLMGI